MKETGFGIDFGTTNTRIAYFDGEKPIVLSVSDERGRSSSIPSIIGYKGGKPVVFGHNAKTRNDVTLVRNIKWLLNQEQSIDVGGYRYKPEEVASHFFKYLKDVVSQSGIREPILRTTAITVPVNFPLLARQKLLNAFHQANIVVSRIYLEPVAALYCHLSSKRDPQIAAVFDWGGGTVDIATVKFHDQKAQVRVMDGLQVGGRNFDMILARRALGEFLGAHRELPVNVDDLLELPGRRETLLMRTETAKIELSSKKKTNLTYLNYVRNLHMDCEISQDAFEQMIDENVAQAIALLKQAVRRSGLPSNLVDSVLLSGGTCNIPYIQYRLKQEFGTDRIHQELPSINGQSHGTAERDVSNATAIGAALLSVFGSKPLFSSEIGIRVAGNSAREDGFYPIYCEGESLRPKARKKEEFFVTNSRTGVARLLLCERTDQIQQPSGRLLKIIPIPIDQNERTVEVTFEVTEHLALNVWASGRVAKTINRETKTTIHDLNLSFEMPEEAARLWTARQNIEALT